jgi:undecaprenyl diphosphate synthase
MSFKEQIDMHALPQHVAIIMDGNGRWAKERGKIRTFGHKHGVAAVRDTTEGAAELGINYLTLYAFSTENWNRPKFEIDALMELLIHTIGKETKTLNDNNIRLQAIGNINSLPKSCIRGLHKAIEDTKNNTRMTLVLALSYSSRWEITEAAKKIGRMVEEKKIKPDDVNEELFISQLTTGSMPDPELLIRTSGEHRISNYLLWQIAYAELYFTDKLWPDFRREDLYEAIVDFQKRERRFGGVDSKKTVKQHA